jgi:DNA polymerase I-like protein with 3'-5' exonuclease and polymerase domains
MALDIETVCNVPDCNHFGHSAKCDHSLSPHHGRVALVAIANDDIEVTFTAEQFADFHRPHHKYIAHNVKFDAKFLRRVGVNLTLDQCAHDTQCMAHVHGHKIPEQWMLEYEAKRQAHKHQRKAGPLSLKTLAPYFLGVDPFWEVEDHTNEEYALKDVRYTWQLFRHFSANMTMAETEFYERRLMPWTRMLLEAEERGFALDPTRLADLKAELTAERDALEKQLDEQWAGAHAAYVELQLDGIREKYEEMFRAAIAKGSDILRARLRYDGLQLKAEQKIEPVVNYDSPTQMLWLLRDHCGYQIGDTSIETLEQLAEGGVEEVKPFVKWRKTKKLLEYLATYEEIAVDGVIHPQFHVTGTRTGRLSSSGPNLQQVNKRLKPVFRARPGYKLLSWDLASIEAKLIAYYTEDPKLYAITAGGQSIHDSNVKVFFRYETPTDDVKKKHPIERAATKNVGFALFYGAGANRIKETFAAKGFHFTTDQCRGLLENYRNEYSTAFKFHREITKLFEKGETMLNLFGRPLAIPDARDAYMKGFNTLIQSSGSDLNCAAAHEALTKARALGADVHLLALIHDNIILEVKESWVEEVEQLLVHAMTRHTLNTRHGPIKLEVEGYRGDRWTE